MSRLCPRQSVASCLEYNEHFFWEIEQVPLDAMPTIW